MAIVDSKIQDEIAQLHSSLRDRALGDVQRAFAGGAKVGAFILAAHVLDTLARLTKEAGTGADAWSQFVKRYLRRYAGFARLLEDGFRNAVSHNYSTRGIRFVDGPDYAARHWTVEGSDRVLHFETFIDELERAYDEFEQNLIQDAPLRKRVLARARQNPPMSLIQDPAPASTAKSLVSAGATSFAPAQSATGSSWLETRIDPLPPPAISKKRQESKKRR